MDTHTTLLFLLFNNFILTCSTPGMADDEISGGLGPASGYSDEVADLVDEIKPKLEEKMGKQFKSLLVLSYKAQAVSGVNFFVKVIAVADSGSEDIIHLKIYRNFAKKLELTSYIPGRTLEEEIDYFD